MLCSPGLKAIDAFTVPPASVPEASVVSPTLNVTVPVGVMVAGAITVTVAVRVMDFPDVAGAEDTDCAVVESLEDFNRVSVPPFLTVCLPASDPLLVLKLASPL